MAKGRVALPPRRNIGKAVNSIIKAGPKQPVKSTIAKAPNQTKVAAVAASRIPKPAQNQRGRIKSLDDRDLTR